MATIEPRLIHLLNEQTTPQLPHTDLPTRNTSLLSPASTSPDRSLAPIHPGAVHRPGLGPDGSSAAGPGSLHLFGEDGLHIHKGEGRQDGKHAGGLAAYPLRLALGDADAAAADSLPPRDDDDAANKKRTHKDDFVQLPQPVKKQKPAQQAHVMPPIINGLYEPPPHAALFPPIASNSFEEHDANQIKLLNEYNRSSDAKSRRASSPEADRHSTKDKDKARKRATKPRRKWSESETKHLLLGVSKYGVGKWTSILEDPGFSFDDRTAGDLKDRFRTCCPDELRRSSKGQQPDSPPPTVAHQARRSSHFENILIEEESSPATDHSGPSNESDLAPRQRKSRAHRKNMADLRELGIIEPFKKSQRRERRPFTDQDDHEILEGLDLYGPAWTKIQRDPRFNFAARQPTDLRDRVRNKHPELYSRIEKGTFQTKDGARSNALMEPSVTTSINNSFERTQSNAFEPQMRDHNHFTHISETVESTPHLLGGGMDISRLLLDNTTLQHAYKKGFETRSGSSSPSATN
jgi:hypothetical protein